MIESKEIGRRMREVRGMYDLTQLDVAERTGTSQVMVSRVEDGVFSGEVLLRFLKFYGSLVSIDVLIDDALWQAVKDDPALLLRKPVIGSIVTEKLKVMREGIVREIETRRYDINRRLTTLENYIKRNMDSAIAMDGNDKSRKH